MYAWVYIYLSRQLEVEVDFTNDPVEQVGVQLFGRRVSGVDALVHGVRDQNDAA